MVATSSPLGSYSAAWDSFYTYFFPSHPFVLPRKELQQQLERDAESLDYVITMINAIGSCYSRQHLDVFLPLDMSPSVFNVQALILRALFAEWNGEDDAADILQRGKEMALKIGLNKRNFTEMERNPVLDETWRRTWWELYIVDAFFAGIRHLPTFNLFSVETDVELPVDSLVRNMISDGNTSLILHRLTHHRRCKSTMTEISQTHTSPHTHISSTQPESLAPSSQPEISQPHLPLTLSKTQKQISSVGNFTSLQPNATPSYPTAQSTRFSSAHTFLSKRT